MRGADSRRARTQGGDRRAQRGEWGQLASRPENPRHFLRGHHFELREGALPRRLVGAPSSKLRRVTEAPAFHVVVRDLDDELRSQWLPRQIFALAPATLPA